MCQPFAMSASTMIGSVRPETTSRTVDPPTTVQCTGRSDTPSRALGKTAEVPVCATPFTRNGAALEATSGNKSRYAELFMRLEIYAPRRNPCVYLPVILARFTNMFLLEQITEQAHKSFYFDGWYDVRRTVTLSIVGFVALIIMLRVSGKRTLSKLNVFDFVFVVACGSVFAASIIEKDVTLIEGIFALATLIGIQVVLAEIAARWDFADRIINGHPTLLFSHEEFIPR